MAVLEQASGTRLFSQWSMGFKHLDAHKASDRKLFQISRAALDDRISRDDGGLFLETVKAFSRDVLDELERSPDAALS